MTREGLAVSTWVCREHDGGRMHLSVGSLWERRCACGRVAVTAVAGDPWMERDTGDEDDGERKRSMCGGRPERRRSPKAFRIGSLP